MRGEYTGRPRPAKPTSLTSTTPDHREPPARGGSTAAAGPISVAGAPRGARRTLDPMTAARFSVEGTGGGRARTPGFVTNAHQASLRRDLGRGRGGCRVEFIPPSDQLGTNSDGVPADGPGDVGHHRPNVLHACI